MEALYRSILEMYTDNRFLQGALVRDVGYNNEVNFVPLDQVDLGPVVNAELHTLQIKHSQAVKTFRIQCRNFLITLAENIKIRFPFHRPDIDILQ